MALVLLTGGTGVVGSEVFKELLAEPGTLVRLIVRAESDAHAAARLEELYRYHEIPANHPARGRIVAWKGDVARPRLGLSADCYDALRSEVSRVIHCAASVQLNKSLVEARRNACEPVERILELLAAVNRRVKLDALSTVGVAGRDVAVLREAPSNATRFHNTYEQAKFEAEAQLLDARKTGLALTLHRPSMVVGHSQTGKSLRKQVFFYLAELLSGKRSRGFVPELGGAILDTVPVDYTAKAICLSSAEEDSTGRIFHLASGAAAIRLSELQGIIRRVKLDRGEALPALRTVSRGIFRTAAGIFSLVAPSAVRKQLRTLPYFLSYLETGQRFDNELARQYFEGKGLLQPLPQQYLSRVIEQF